MDRRKFLRRAGAFSIPMLTGMPGVRAAGSSLLASVLPPDSDKVLVLVQLAGGNDGLNTLIPTDQLGELQAVRPNLYMPTSSMQPLTTSLSFHSRMTAMKNMFDSGRLSIIQDVGYPNQNRSHFRSTDIWTTASDANVELETGWVGRHLEVDFPNYPTGYPTSTQPDPPAISMGNVANATCQGVVTNLSQTVTNPFDSTSLTLGGDTPLPNDNYGEELGFLRVAIEQTDAYGGRIQAAANAGNTIATYPTSNLGRDLQNVARLISGGLQTSIYVVTMGGFDTHDSQANGDNTSGRHADLLEDLSNSLAAFQQDLDDLGLADRVLGMTFSEFGRRIRSNGSRGTDHGTAAPLFVFGNCASGNILGSNPVIDTNVDPYEGIPMQYDFRDIYGSILMDWFGVAESQVRNLLYPNFTYLAVANGCSAAFPVELLDFTATGLDKTIRLAWQTAREEDNRGFEIERSQNGRDFTRIGFVAPRAEGSAGVRTYEFMDTNVSSGPLYYYRLKQLDTDGDFEYSTVRTARLVGAAVGEWSFGHAFPNPVETETTVQVYAPRDGRVNYALYSSTGQRMMADSATLYGRRDNQITVRLGGRMPSGTYTLRFTTDDGNQASRKIVVR